MSKGFLDVYSSSPLNPPLLLTLPPSLFKGRGERDRLLNDRLDALPISQAVIKLAAEGKACANL